MGGMLRLYNTLTRAKAEFAPIDPGNVRLYACGPTVYDDAHIGNARPIIVFDLLFRLLRHRYGEAHVTYVRNVTDVEDKINARAIERSVSIRELTDGTLARFHEDLAALGVLPPTHEPRATDYIEEMRAIIDRLVQAGHAYVAQDHVLFDVPSMPTYGRLSRRPLDEMEAGARVEVAPYKRSPLDFVLWKPSEGADPAWPSPAGIAQPGRPGWHVECSAMSWKLLGETFDIHAGGIDLVFPHHENEIAQSCCAFGREVMANVWLHNGFLQVEGDKMSKSLGNFVTLREVLRDWPGEVVRLAMLRTHYRQPIDWTVKGLADSYRLWSKWIALNDVPGAEAVDTAVLDALDDDLNTPLFITRLDALSDEARVGNGQALEQFTTIARLFGFIPAAPGTFFFPAIGFDANPGEELARLLHNLPSSYTLRTLRKFLQDNNLSPSNGFPDVAKPLSQAAEGMSLWALKSKLPLLDSINLQMRAREEARTARDWVASGAARDALKAMGVVVKDNKDGSTTWEVVR